MVKKMRRSVRFIIALGILALLFPSAQAFAQSCKDDSNIIAACFTVHGRISYWNGTPSARLWPIGTHRLLGISERDEYGMPPELKKLAPDLDDEVYGDFTVCPYTSSKPGEMQFVCVESFSNAIVKRRHN